MYYCRFILQIIAVFTVMLIFSSCERKEETIIGSDHIITAQDEDLVASLFDDVFGQVTNADRQTQLDERKGASNDTCPVITIVSTDTSTLTRQIIIDFGVGCSLVDGGLLRQGKILVTKVGRYLQEGSVRTITFDDYYVEGNKIEGTKTITNNGRNEKDNLTYTIEVENAIITRPAETTIEWDANRTREFLNGEDTPLFIWDDEYEISGSSSGTNSLGKDFTHTITSPLNVYLACRWIRSGIIEITIENRPTLTLDYGDGTCDNKATISVNDRTREINLR